MASASYGCETAFLNGNLQEEVYVQQPPGFIHSGQEHKVLRLHKALYGLHQAPRVWNLKLDEELGMLGFVKCTVDHAIYCRGGKGERLIVGVYVDDLLITRTSTKSIGRFKQEMADVFKMSDLGLLTYYLVIQVQQSTKGIILSHESYAKKNLEKGGLLGCNSCQVPMQPKLKLKKESELPRVDATEYRSLVGSLRYLVNTRPDLAYSVGYVSRFIEDPHEDRLAAVKQILRFVAGSSDIGVFYPKSGDRAELKGYSDSDLARDLDSRKSTTWVLFFFGKSPVSWQSTKQRVVALSSCEVEYIAAATAACQGVWLARLLSELKDAEIQVPVLRVDNKSTISLVKNPVHHDRSKHIDVRYHLIQEYEQTGQIVVEFIRTEEQLRDILTKPLGKIKFKELCNKIGLKIQ
jgi:hypothetical protein